MFQNSNQQTTLPSSSVLVPSEHQKAYGAGETIRFVIPDYIKYIDMKQSFLNFKLEVTCARPVRLSPDAGAHALINRVRVYDGSQQIQLENCENYAERVAITHHYSSNQSVSNKRSLLEAVEPLVSRDLPNTINNWGRSLMRSSLSNTFDGATGADLTITDVNVKNANQLEIALQIETGVFSTPSAFPNGHLGGMILEIDLNPAVKAFQLVAVQGITQSSAIGVPPAAEEAVPTDATKQFINIKDVCIGAAQTPTAGSENSAVATGVLLSSAGQEVNVDFEGNIRSLNNMNIGDILLAQGAGNAGEDITSLGAITGFRRLFTPLGTGLLNEVIIMFASIDISLVPLIANAKVFVTVGNLDSENDISYKLKDIRLVMKQVEVPAQYDQAMMKASMTEEGMDIDIWTYDTYRNNIQSGESVSQVLIPSHNSRVKSVFSIPMGNEGVSDDLWSDTLSPVLDTIKDYQWYVNGIGFPTRAVDLTTLSAAQTTTAQIALWEQEKALSSCGVPVSCLSKQQDHFFLGRALARYNGVYNLREAGGVQLKTTYSNAVLNKLLITYICHIRKVVVSSRGKFVEL
tara:strand:- start:54 stop:1778 length:1725 start_codon:yes stop_codon:yes gene_type:complete